jgi:hypothetical protein
MMFCLTTGPDQQSQGLWTETSKTMSQRQILPPFSYVRLFCHSYEKTDNFKAKTQNKCSYARTDKNKVNA